MYSVSGIELGLHDQPRVTLSSPHHDSCQVYLYGATVTSWKNDGKERLFCSPTTPFNGVAAIRGGIPLVFPQFGRPNEIMPQHGFARTSTWSVAKTAADETSASVTFTLTENEHTLAVWPHAFSLQYVLTLTEAGLRTTFSAANTGDSPFECQALLHTYIATPPIDQVCVEGFQGLSFHDKMDPPTGSDFPTDARQLANIDREVDRIYLDDAATANEEGDTFALPTVRVLSQVEGADPQVVLKADRKAYIKSDAVKSLATDCVLWNAWIDKCKAIGDLEDDAYLRYVCVEPGVCSRFESVGPNETLVLDQFLSV